MTPSSFAWLLVACLCGTHLYPLISKSLVLVDLASLVLKLQEHYGGGRHIEAAWSLISEGLYSQELDFMNTPFSIRKPLGKRGSACVEVMTTLHGSTPSLWRLSLGPIRIPFLHMGAFVGFQSRVSSDRSIDTFNLGLTSWVRVRGRLIRVSDQLDQIYMDSQVVIVYQFAIAMASIQEAIASLGQRMDGHQTASQDTQIPLPPSLGQTVP
ncbi:hypothetical protein CK203_045825 [Vitis vinifera]|uniref:Secreted protein n=1 Tax=Vitis vinifera TaxID=29760 RepID=A0A438FM19_VITVI|nr:hypothetical protein CK203_045825 [Vitis vinifera]